MATVAEMDDLREEMHRLRQQLQEKEENLQMSAHFGKQLLENVDELTKQNEDTTRDFTEKLEALEQSKYSVQLKLENKMQMEKTYLEEIDTLKKTLKKAVQENRDVADVQHAAQISELKKQLTNIRSECDCYALTERQLKEEKNELEVQLEETREQLEQRTNALNETCSEEMAALHTELSALNQEKISLTSKLSEQRRSHEQMALQVQTLQSRFASGENELEEARCQSTSYYNALEKSREEVQELKVELELLRMETQDQKRKGNSLFSEVEDRRVEAERELISLKVQNSSLKKQYDLARQHLHKLKLQYAALIQMSAGRTDVEHMERLESQLGQARSEIQELHRKLHHAETQEKTTVDNSGQVISQMSDKNFQNYVEALLKTKEEKLAEVKSELSTQRLLLHAESEKVINLERKLHSAERQVDLFNGRCMKQQLQLEELQMKYEPEKFKGTKTKKGRVERITLVSEADSTEDKENKEKNQLVIRDAPRKNSRNRIGSEKASEAVSSTTADEKDKEGKLQEARPAPEENEAVKATHCSEPPRKPLNWKLANKKKVSIRVEPDIAEVSSTTDDCEIKLNESEQDDNGEGKKGRPRGRERHTKVTHVARAPKDSQCQQQ